MDLTRQTDDLGGDPSFWVGGVLIVDGAEDDVDTGADGVGEDFAA